MAAAGTRGLTFILAAMAGMRPGDEAAVRRVQREQVERRLHNVVIVRNRAAHHEPIDRRDLARDFRDAVTSRGLGRNQRRAPAGCAVAVGCTRSIA